MQGGLLIKLPNVQIPGLSTEQGRTVKDIFKLSFLTICSLSQTFMLVATGVMIGQLSGLPEDKKQLYLDASALITNWMNFLLTLSYPMPIAISVLASAEASHYEPRANNGQLLNNEEADAEQQNDQAIVTEEDIRRTSMLLKNGFILSLINIIPSMLLMFFISNIAKHIAKQPEAPSDLTRPFFQTYAFSLPFMALRLTLEQIYFGFKKASYVAPTSLASFAIGTIIAATALNATKQIAYIALGYFFEILISIALLTTLKFRTNTFKRFEFFKSLLYPYSETKQQLSVLFQIGWPIWIQYSFEAFFTVGLSFLAKSLSEKELAAFGISTQTFFITSILMYSFGITAQVTTKAELEKNNFQAAKRYATYSTALCATIVLLFPVIPTWITPGWLTKTIASTNVDAETAALAAPTSRWMAGTALLEATRFCLTQALKANHDLKAPPTIAIVANVVGFCLALGLKNTSLRLQGIAIGPFISTGFAVIYLLHRYHKQFYQSPLFRRNSEVSGTNARKCWSLFCDREEAANNQTALELTAM